LIKEKLIVENLSAHLGERNVNNDIRNTIDNEKYNPYFIDKEKKTLLRKSKILNNRRKC